MSELCVIKVGGSLFDLPDLRERLRRFLAGIDTQRLVLMPGGGATTDAIRALDRTHRLGEETAHWLALGALSVNARFLATLLPEAKLVSSLANASGSVILDPLPFFEADEACAAHLPHTWSVTSDSLAVRVAQVMDAREAILLKSVAWSGTDWQEAARTGIVDRYFPQVIAVVPASLRVRVVNLRTLA